MNDAQLNKIIINTFNIKKTYVISFDEFFPYLIKLTHSRYQFLRCVDEKNIKKLKGKNIN